MPQGPLGTVTLPSPSGVLLLPALGCVAWQEPHSFVLGEGESEEGVHCAPPPSCCMHAQGGGV